MASRHETRTSSAPTSEEIEEALHRLGKLIDRLKVMYEQYFMGIQKLAPAQLHRDADRQIRELTQLNIRNTALRFRFANLTQKFGSYNTYWRRTMRQIEQGKYLRDIQRVARKAQRTGEDIPEEILAAMPKRIREKILRDREMLARHEARKVGLGDGVEGDAPQRRPARPDNRISEADLGDFDMFDADDDFDLDSAFGSIMAEAEAAVTKQSAPPARSPTPPRPATTPAAPPPRAAPTQARPAPPPATARPTAAPPPIPRSAPPPIPRKPASPAAATARPNPSASRPVPRPAPRPPDDSPVPGMTLKQTQELHKRYLQGQRMVGDGKQVSYDQLMKTLKRQAPQIMKQHNASGVEFNVAIKNDKVILKAKPKK